MLLSYKSCGFYSFFTSRSSFNDNFRRNYQTHFQPFLDDFHVGKTTHQACFVSNLVGIEPTRRYFLSYFPSNLVLLTQTVCITDCNKFVLVLKGVEPSFSDRKSDVLPLHHRTKCTFGENLLFKLFLQRY